MDPILQAKTKTCKQNGGVWYEYNIYKYFKVTAVGILKKGVTGDDAKELNGVTCLIVVLLSMTGSILKR